MTMINKTEIFAKELDLIQDANIKNTTMLNERNLYGTTAFIGQEKYNKKPQNLSLL